jgi:hypothetical protein
VLFSANQIVQFFDQLDEFGMVFLYLNLVHKLVHSRALVGGHRVNSSRVEEFCRDFKLGHYPRFRSKISSGIAGSAQEPPGDEPPEDELPEAERRYVSISPAISTAR